MKRYITTVLLLILLTTYVMPISYFKEKISSNNLKYPLIVNNVRVNTAKHCKSKEIYSQSKSIYKYYSLNEIYLICKTVETECYDQDFEAKCNVASVIFNRIDRGGVYGDSVKEVITKPNQFAYVREVISDDTKSAVEFVFTNGDTTNGCIGFHSNKVTDSFNGWEYSFSDSSHHFYKMEDEKNGE